MNSPADLVDEKSDTELQSCLPPILCFNPHKKVEPGKVDVNDLVIDKEKHKRTKKSVYSLRLVKSPVPAPIPQLPIPSHPLYLTWYPEQMYFNISADVIVDKLWILNSSLRTVNLICCGFWGDTARLGASWCCYPRTRFILAPGMKSHLTIKATPRLSSPVSLAYIGLQLCASHMRDHVSGYFVVPIVVKFSNYEPPCCEEGE